MLFSKEFLIEQVGEGVQSTIVEHSRWSVHYEEIFEHEGKYYRTYYSVGATESQDEQPYEYDEDMIECQEVEQVKRYVSVWKDVK